MATRDINLCNQALIKLGVKMIANYTDNEVGMLCDLLFQTSMDVFSTMFTWTWNEEVSKISAEADPSPAPVYYSYSFPLPADFLQLRLIDDYTTKIRITDYDIRKKKIYCNYEDIAARYAIRIAADDLPYLCDDAFSSYLAHRLAPSLEDSAKSLELWQEFLQKGQSAFLEDAKQRKSPIDPDNYHPESR